MRVIVEQLVEWRLAGETEVLGENLPQRHGAALALGYAAQHIGFYRDKIQLLIDGGIGPL
jgi:hypothetical protein